jgi:lysozyme
MKSKPPARKNTDAAYKAEIRKNTAVIRPPVKRKSAAAKKKQKRSYIRLKIALVILVLILASPLYYRYIASGFISAWHWVNDIGEDTNYRHYKNFNIHVSEKYSIHGIDVSYAQGKIDWPQVRGMEENGLRISFVFIKATEGEDFVDSYFQRNWREAAKNGFVCGAYHFFRPEKSGKLQAQLFLKTVRPEQGDLPPVVDVEQLDGMSPEHMRAELDAFFATMRHRLRVKPIIYTGLSFYHDYLKSYENEYPLWIAHYDKPEDRINAAADWRFWQHSSQATVNGIHHAVDFDTFRGDSTAFKNLLVH